MSNDKTLAWIGLGAMGGPMAAAQVKAGFTVQGYDISEKARTMAAETGVDIKEDNSEAVRDADVIFLSLPAGPQVRETLDGDAGVWANAKAGAVIIDTSSVDLETSQWSHDESEKRGFGFVDSPISGGVIGAHAGTLTIMLGGSDDAVAVARTYSEPYSRKIIHLGGPTTGMAAKLCNNMLLFTSVVATSEAVQLAVSKGIDQKAFWELLSSSTGHSWSQENWFPYPGVIETSAADKNFEPTGFPATGAHKDLQNALDMGATQGADLPFTQLAADRIQEIIDSGRGMKDVTLVNDLVFPDQPLAGYDPDADAK